MLSITYTEYQFFSPFPARLTGVDPKIALAIMVLETAFAVYMSWRK